MVHAYGNLIHTSHAGDTTNGGVGWDGEDPTQNEEIAQD